MASNIYQIRECVHCSLRFPLIDNEVQNTRCPACLGLTELISNNNFARGFELVDDLKPPDRPKPVRGVLDNIRSALNVGAIFRTADGLGLEHLYLCGITPSPENPGVLKTGLGAQDTIGWSSHLNGINLVRSIKAEGAGIIVLENKKDALSINEVKTEDLSQFMAVVLVVGNEVMGVDPGIIELADTCMNIPMHGLKQSLNVSVAFAIAAYVISSKIEPLRSGSQAN